MRNYCNSYKKFISGLEDINKAAQNHPQKLINDIEECYKKELWNIAKNIVNRKSKRKIIMISGPSASGKTTTTRILKSYIEKNGAGATFISLDNFYKDRKDCVVSKNGTVDYEAPESLNIPEFKRCMKQLLEQGKCAIPEFNFVEKVSEPQKIPIEVSENDVAIIEGMHGLNPIFTAGIPEENVVRVYISVKQGINDVAGEIISNRDIRLIRRIVRDYQKRNSSPEMTLSMWDNVCKGQDKHIHPFKSTSDATINSLHLYELGVMKKRATELLKEVPQNSEFYTKASTLMRLLENFVAIDESAVPKDSLIREFIGGGTYH